MPPPSMTTPRLLVDEPNYEYQDTRGRSYRCRIRIYEATDGDQVVILATEEARPDKPDLLIPLAAPIATDVRRVYGITDRPYLWIEHHDDRNDPGAMAIPFLDLEADPDTIRRTDRPEGQGFSLLTFAEHGSDLSQPLRTPISRAAVERLIGGPLT